MIPLINPAGHLLPEIEQLLFLARKSKPLWARMAETSCEIASLEGRLTVASGDYVCRGIHGEKWAQKSTKLFEKYDVTEEIDADGWQRFEPKPDAAPVQAAQVDYAFRVVAQWGELTGKSNDYVARSTSDPSDVWIVDRTIFEASYERVAS